MAVFADVFKGLRLAHGYTQDELAKKLNFSKSRVNMYERGDREPNIETLELISDFFNVDMNFLLGRTDKTTKVLPGVQVSSNDYSHILDLLEQINEEGLEKVVEYIEGLIALGKYKKHGQSELNQKEA